jgi:eukaryotic-like serine/threonine-protein kinase
VLQLIGRYRVRERIGDGAMADVYRAFDPSIDRELAIKVLKAELRQNPEYVARFLREARAAGALSHPSIVTIYDVGEAEGYPYIAMELLEGEPLDAVLKRQPQLPVEDVLAIGVQLADALAYAHGCGVVHRDIKPSNIVLGRDGRSVKILDFGIARLTQSTGDHETESLKTQIGQVMGTPRYMSPEQVLGGDIDGRSDLFSTGVVLYEMITGQRAFTASSAATLALQIIRDDPRPMGELVRNTPAGLQFVIAKLLAKRPERRFADGAELAAALRREAQAIEAASADTRARRYLPMQVRLAAAMAAVTGLVLAASIWGVLDRQYEAMERMALSSGSAIATFVASNASLSAVENAGLPAAEQDWAPVTAFVQGAAGDPNVRQMMVVDAAGVIQASTRPELVGRIYRAASGEPVVRRVGAMVATDTRRSEAEAGFRFVRPIQYAGRSFGLVDVTISKAELASAARLSTLLMAALAIIVTGVVGLVSFAGARLLAQPIMRLKTALRDAAATGAGLRISHDRRDEFGELFDGFNAFSQAVQERLERVEGTEPLAHAATPALPPSDLADDATRIGQHVEAVLERTRVVSAEAESLRTVLYGKPAPSAG